MVANLCPPIAQLGIDGNAISVGSRKDWDEYVLKRLGQVASAPSTSVVIKEIVETLADLGLQI